MFFRSFLLSKLPPAVISSNDNDFDYNVAGIFISFFGFFFTVQKLRINEWKLRIIAWMIHNKLQLLWAMVRGGNGNLGWDERWMGKN